MRKPSLLSSKLQTRWFQSRYALGRHGIGSWPMSSPLLPAPAATGTTLKRRREVGASHTTDCDMSKDRDSESLVLRVCGHLGILSLTHRVPQIVNNCTHAHGSAVQHRQLPTLSSESCLLWCCGESCVDAFTSAALKFPSRKHSVGPPASPNLTPA
jgi:hypothetical protein